jgi:hypothetical protein
MSSHRKRGFTDWRKVKKAKRDNADAEKPVLSSLDSYNAGTNPVPPPLNTQVITADAGLDAVTPYRTFPYLYVLTSSSPIFAPLCSSPLTVYSPHTASNFARSVKTSLRLSVASTVKL